MARSARFELGESLATIAHRELGIVDRWRDLADLNSIDIFSNIPIGTELQIPSVQDIERLARDRIGSVLGEADLSSLARGVNGQSLNQAIKLISFLY
ncbi:LysM peptidoglycan-binding domain-containing protein [Oculatella sp. LEGE 06141]|uniref:LysM peptidoglycan-binding domain-containing protein n=1 Tax=Oculatella sp. LEGE 06141 TaxID=1828648 RepID=UPI0018809829|nr:LysM peptidoglycan-binding domain-containing protein [Oculatella sp. LEGE 06141]MBE9178667.1 LysM peptidoglycan-binding domain-containing protein [Oculatella sp. LEGE 06141]